MISFRRLSRAQTIVAVTIGVVAVVWLMIALNLWHSYRSYHQESVDLVPRIARLSGLIESEPRLRAANEQVSAQLAGFTFPPTADPAAAGAGMQQQIRNAFEKAGLTVAGSQILPPRVDPLFTRIQLEVTANGPLESLEAALLELPELRPLVLVDSLNIQPARGRRGDSTQSVTIRLRLTSLRVLP